MGSPGDEIVERTGQRLVAFYDERVPQHVTSARHFDRWWRDEHVRRPDLLSFTPELLLEGDVDPASYPDVWRVDGTSFPLSYAFEPGTDHDGVTVEVPLAAVPALRREQFEWQVPGLRLELVTALLRTLPKPLRRNVTPVAEAARTSAEQAVRTARRRVEKATAQVNKLNASES